jgi:hypothetical protein
MKNLNGLTLGFIFRLMACVLYGLLVGYLAITAAKTPPGFVDNSSYQNFGIIVGAIVGLSFFIFAHIIHILLKRRAKSELPDFLLHIVTGVMIGFVSSFIVHLSANSYGFINANRLAIIIGSVIPAVIGGGLPAIVLSLIRV